MPHTTGEHLVEEYRHRDDLPEEPQKRKYLISFPKAFLLFFIVTFLVFGNSLFAEYAYDGELLINRMAGYEWSDLDALINPEAYGNVTGILSWRPLTALLYMAVDDQIFGLNPSLSHALNLVFHALNGLLLFLLIRRFNDFTEGDYEIAGILGALFFTVHPLVTEAVLCAGFRADLSALTFVLWSLNCIASWMERRDHIYLAAAIILYGIALLFKEIAIVALPLAPILVYMHVWDAKSIRAWGVFGSFALIFVVWFLAWRLFRTEYLGPDFLGNNGRALGIANFLVVSSEIYLSKLFLPWPLRIDYAFEPIATFADWRLLVALIFVAFVLLAIAIIGRGTPAVIFGVLWVLAGFLPVSQIIVVPDPIAERFTYVPMAGVAFIVAGLIEIGLRRKLFTRRLIVFVSIPVLLILGGLSFLRSFDWRTDIQLNIANWEAADNEQPITLESLGALYLTRAQQHLAANRQQLAGEDLDASWQNIQRLLEVDPDSANANRLAAVWHLLSNKPEDAKPYAITALRLAPNDPLVQQTARAAGVLP